MALQIDVFGNNGTRTVVVSGDVDLDGKSRFVDALRAASDGVAGTVIVDLALVTFMDSTGLNALVGAWHRSEQSGCRLVLANPPTAIQQLLRISGLDDVLEITTSESTSARIPD